MEHVEVPALLAQLKLEEKIKEGAENMLHEFSDQRDKNALQHRRQVLVQLEAANTKINALKDQLKSLGHNEDQVSSPEMSPKAQKLEPIALLRSHGGSSTSVNIPQRRRSSTMESSPQQFSALFDSLDAKEDAQISSSKAIAIETLLSSYPTLRSEFAIGQMLEKLRTFMLSPDSLILAVGFHLCRILATSRASVAVMRNSLCLDYYIIRSLSRSDANAELTERSQVMRLIQAILDLHNGISEISQGVIRAMVAVVECSKGDQLKEWSTVNLGQIALFDPQKAFESGAITALLNMLLEAPRDVAVSVTYVLCSLLDMPQNRKYFRNGKDLNCVLSVFTSCISDNQTDPTTERLQVTIEIVSIILGNWAGLASFDIESLINCLSVPSRMVQDAILDILCLTLGTSPEKLGDDVGDTQRPFQSHLLAYLLNRLFAYRLFDRLYAIRASPNVHTAIRTKANLLSGYMVRVASLVLPQSTIAKMMSLPKVFTKQLNAARGAQIPAAGGPIFQMNKAIRAPEKVNVPSLQNPAESSTFDSHKVIQLGQGSSVWIKVGSQMDEVAFRQLIQSTHVLETKAFSRWNWDALLELVQGPLHNPKRLDEAFRSTKFMKRLMSFYRPFKYRFSSVKNNPQSRKYTHVGKEMIITLLATPEGVKYLSANKILRQIAECLAQLDPTSGITSSEPLLSAQRIKATLAYGYFEIIGVMTRYSAGSQILSQLKVFNMLYNICNTDRIDVIRHLIVNMDYTLNGHPRVILAKALARGKKPVKLFATKFLQTLGKRDHHLWVIDLLVIQLYDHDIDVCNIAVSVLQELSLNTDYLDHFISLKPSLEHLGSLGDSLYIIFMSRPAGYRYLAGFEFVSQEMDEWVHGYNETYVREIEDYISLEATSARPPRHFFGELVLTEEGAKFLSTKNYIETFHRFITQNGGTQNPEIIVKLKGYMWALGYIASQPLGASLISPEIVQAICDTYIQTEVFSVQGTAFYVLGLVASSFEGAEILNQAGWATALSPFGDQLGIALVEDISVVKSNSLYTFSCEQHSDEFDFGDGAVSSTESLPATLETLAESLDSQGKSILTQISDLSNQILANEASKILVTLRSQDEEMFKSTELFKCMMTLLEKYRYKQLSRKFLFEMFDTQNILEKLARKRPHKPIVSRPN